MGLYESSRYILVAHVTVVTGGYIGFKIYSETWELGTPKGLSKTVLNSEVVLFLRSISM